jgi:hypothetical protein
VGKRVLELVSFIFKLLLNLIEEFLLDDGRIEPGYCDRLSLAAALVSIVI